MEPSNFIEWVAKYLPGLVIRQVDRVNANEPRTYLFRQLLRRDFSVTGKWESLSSDSTMVAADIVAMDSPLPLKRRGVLAKATGDIPKLGLEYQLNEKQLTELDTLVAIGGTEAQIVEKLFSDLPNAVGGHYERLEFLFLYGLSRGIALVDDPENVGAGIRLDYKYLPENQFVADTPFSDAGSNPFDIIQATILDKAETDGYVVTKIYTDKATIQNIANSTQAKQFFAFNSGFVGTAIPAPDFAQLNTVAQNRYGFVFVEVSRSVRVEKNGVRTTVKPWLPGAMVAVTSDQIGSWVYATLAEQNHPIDGVTYNLADGFILTSVFRRNEPSLSEVIKAQSRAVPVISNVEQIYVLDSTGGDEEG